MVVFLASRVVVYLAMSSKSDACCGVLPIVIDLWLIFAFAFRSHRAEIGLVIIHTDRVVNSFPERWLRDECFLNGRDLSRCSSSSSSLGQGGLVNGCERHN